MIFEDQQHDHSHLDADGESAEEHAALQAIDASLEELLQHVCCLAAFKPSVADEHHAARYIAGDITLAEFLAAEV